jgi:hypothetical protein
MIAILNFLRSLRYRLLPTTRNQAAVMLALFFGVRHLDLHSNPYGLDGEVLFDGERTTVLVLSDGERTTVLFRCLSVETWVMHVLFFLVSCYCCFRGVSGGEWPPLLAGLALWPGILFTRFVVAGLLSPKIARVYRKIPPGAAWIGPTSEVR